MRPRFAADYRTLVWVFILFPGVALSYYVNPGLIPWLLPVSIYLGYCAGVISHNHNHCPTFASRGMNDFFAAWLSVFYGYPLFGWIPTHNLNHHKYVNKAGDATITWRYTRKHTFLVAISYFFVSSYWQAGPLKEYLAKAKLSNGRVYKQIRTQAAAVISGHVGMLALGIALHGVKTGVLVYCCGLGLPAAFALWSMMFTNYIQHVHCDPWSPDNHSRNFVGKISNWFVFDAGYHTVHHENAGTHWSHYPKLHAARAARIAPELNENDILTFCFRTYFLGLFSDRFRTHQVGRAAYEGPQGQDLRTAEVSAEEAGVNASMQSS